MSLSLAQLRAVDAVARHGQISRAAQSLGLSQPSISNQIQTFEAAWQIRFFDRDGYTITVRPDAEALLGRIRLALDLFNEIETGLTAQSAMEASTLSLGFSAHRLIMPALAKFVAHHPDIRISTLGAPSFDLLKAVKRGEIHLASISSPDAPAGLHAVEVARRKLVVYGKRDHPLLAKAHIDLAELDGVSMVLWNENSGSRRQFDTICAAQEIFPKVAMAVNTLDVSYAAVAAGIGLGVAVEHEVQEDDYVKISSLQADGAEVGQYLVCLKGAELRPQIASFIEIAQETATVFL